VQSSFFQKRFVIVAGKGGVGKSTLAAAIGLAASRRGLRTLVAELNTSDKVAQLLGHPPVGHCITEVRPGLSVINIQPEPALEEYGVMKLKLRAAYRVVFENELMRRLLRLIPGMNELLLIGKAWYEEDRKGPDGRPYWDMVVVDAPATGHGVSLFRLPHVILSAVQSGPLADDTRRIAELLTDPRRTSFNIATLPEEMPFAETLSLVAQANEILRVPLGFLFVNQVLPAVLPQRGAELVHTFREAQRDLDPRMASILECASYLEGRAAQQGEILEKLRGQLRLPHVEIPFRFDEEFGSEAIASIAEHVEAEVERSDSIARARGR
jgi:anion-transporting  ArsA/GET3 family ATPase